LKTVSGKHADPRKGRGAGINPEGRFENAAREAFDDGWNTPPDDDLPPLKTHVTVERVASIIAHNESPDVPFTQSINPYAGCEHGCSYCVHGDTPVLLGNGRTRPIAELRVGDEIYGTTRSGWYRRYVKSRVLAHWSVIKPAYRIVLEDGTELITSGDHRFLTERGWKFVKGTMGRSDIQRPYLTTNNKLMGTGAFAKPPIKDHDYKLGYLCGIIRGDANLASYPYQRANGNRAVMHSFRLALCDEEALWRANEYLHEFQVHAREFAFQQATATRRAMYGIRTGTRAGVDRIRSLISWPADPSRTWSAGFLSGIFDAEGSFSTCVLRISNTDSEIIDWIRRSLSVFGFRFSIEPGKRDRPKPVDVVRLDGGLREHLRFFHAVDPAISRKLNIEGQAVKSNALLRIVRIEPAGRAMRLYDITTETEDFIANGVVSHNCYARPTHAYRNLSPGIDFETRLFAKVNAAEKLREELSRPGYRCEVISIGANTDPYQPIERQHKITRGILEVCAEFNQPFGIVTKNAMVERDLDILAPMAKKNLANVFISVNNLDHDLARRLEPRCSAPARRLQAMKTLSDAGVPVGVLCAPVIPFLTDHQIEAVLEAAWQNGARQAGYVLMRLPWEVKDLFKDWLERHYPLKAKHVMSRVHAMRGGRDNDPNFGSRMRGSGELAALLSQRFKKACQRLGFNAESRNRTLDTTQFRRPGPPGQLSLFGDA
jgi:DNA repair photolyase